MSKMLLNISICDIFEMQNTRPHSNLLCPKYTKLAKEFNKTEKKQNQMKKKITNKQQQ